ncbi:MAG TPA: hypothetical protein VNI54_17875 [Thermoanaerobaculia bacterium]|nr:hypothetical protein [Thermoanaerobaculia bacterium]
MLIVGTETVYLSHLPMFQPMLQEEEQPRMPHRYQAILEVTIGKQNGYVRDRREHASTRIYTLTPEDFVLPELVSSDPQGKPRRSFKADEIFRGHLERDDGIPILQNVNVSVKNVIYFREFDPKDKKSPQLEYLLFGKGPELFMAHVITAAPDFDQVMAVKVTGHKFTNAELARGVRVVFPDKTNAVASRLREKQRVAGEIKIDQAAVPKRIQVEVTREFYFEEGELRLPADPLTTAAEQQAGFP